MGTGVEDDETYENLVEDRLNATRGPQDPPVEILNFSVAGHGPLSRLYDIERKVMDFQPDVLVLVALDDIGWSTREFLNGVLGEYELPWPELYEMATAWGIEPGMDRVVAEARVRPHRFELLGWTYQRIMDQVNAHGMRAFLLVLPRPRQETEERMAQVAEQMQVARDVGMTPISLLSAYSSAKDLSTLWVANWDRHPNAEGHRLLANAFYDAIVPYLRTQS